MSNEFLRAIFFALGVVWILLPIGLVFEFLFERAERRKRR